MPEFSFALPGLHVAGVVATDATDEVIHDAVAADVTAGAPTGQERRLEAAQIVYTAVSTESEPLTPAPSTGAGELTETQRAALPALEANAIDDAAAYIAVKSELPLPESGPIGPVHPPAG